MKLLIKKNITDLQKLADGELGIKGMERLRGAMARLEIIDSKADKEEDRRIANLYRTTLTDQVRQSTESKKLIDNLSKSKLMRENQLRQSYVIQGNNLTEGLKNAPNAKEAFKNLSLDQQTLLKNLDGVRNGSFPLDELFFDASKNQQFEKVNVDIKKLLSDFDKQEKDAVKEQKGEKYYQKLEEELETDITFQMGDFSNMKPRELWLVTQESNIAQRQPLDKFDPSKVEEYKQAVLQTQEDTRYAQGEKQLIDADAIVAPGGPFFKAPDGSLARVGTATENTPESKAKNTQSVIEKGIDDADKVVLSRKPLDIPMAAGKDLGGMFEDVMNYSLGLVGIEGQTFDDISQKMFGADLELGDRQKSVKQLNSINMQILPLLVGSINSRGNVWTQKLVKDEVIAGPNMSNADVRDRLSEYPGLLNIAYQNALTTLNNPAVNQGTELYAKAQEIALKEPTIRKQLDYALGNIQPPDSSYKMSPNMRKILDTANSPQDIDSNASTGVIDSGLQSMSTDDLNKMRADLLNSRDN